MQRGWTPLLCVAYRGYANLVDIILKAGANIDTSNKVRKFYLLAFVLQDLCCMYFTCISNAYLTQNGSTALFLASQENHIKVVKILLAAGANVHLKNSVILLPDTYLILIATSICCSLCSE